MKVLDLRCAQGHGFEGWFGSEADYQSQQERGLLTCPLCADTSISRLPSAPRLNLSGAREPSAQVSATAPVSEARSTSAATPLVTQPATVTPSDALPPTVVGELQRAWLAAVRHVVQNTEDVGPRFAEEVRRIHYGETEHRAIRGQASAEEREALHDEGIETLVLPVPKGLDGPLQ